MYWLKRLDPSIVVIPRAVLRAYTTFQLGGRCRALVFCETSVQLRHVARGREAGARRLGGAGRERQGAQARQRALHDEHVARGAPVHDAVLVLRRFHPAGDVAARVDAQSHHDRARFVVG